MSKNSKDIVFVAAQRSAIGKYKGIYKDLQAHNLGSLVIKSLIEKGNDFLDGKITEKELEDFYKKSKINVVTKEFDNLLTKLGYKSSGEKRYEHPEVVELMKKYGEQRILFNKSKTIKLIFIMV